MFTANKQIMSESRLVKPYALPRHPTPDLSSLGAKRSDYELDTYCNTQKFTPHSFQEPTFKRELP
jgi:hypothetical protein